MPSYEAPVADKESEREELHKHVEDFLAKGGSIEQLSHSDFAAKEAKLNSEEYKAMFKQNLSFGHKRNLKFNGRIRRED